jgi:SAM-dependent methyltransferase
MRSDWNQRARSDAYYYATTGRRHQESAEFLGTAELVLPFLRSALARIRTDAATGPRRALEVGCGPGRLMLPMSRFFDEIHGVDVSDEMLALASRNLRDVTNVRLARNSGSDLAAFEASYFDFVYSYAVFQHIPSIAVVSRYLEESARVLKPGGVLCCQLRGGELRADDRARNDPTWVGCIFPFQTVFELCRICGMHLLQISGVDMQEMWMVGRTPSASAGAHRGQHVFKAVTPTDNPFGMISRSGPGAAFVCWLEGFPESLSLEAVSVTLGGIEAVPSYISEHLGNGGFQLNVLVPPGAPLGEAPVRMLLHGAPVAGQFQIEIREYPVPEPKLVSVTDGVDLLAESATATASFKVLLTGVADPDAIVFELGLLAIEEVTHYCNFPHAFGYEFTLQLPPGVAPGPNVLRIKAQGWESEAKVDVLPGH